MKKLLILAGMIALVAAQAGAAVITFDDIDGDPQPKIADGYGGFLWNTLATPGNEFFGEIHVLDAVDYCTDCGYRNNMVSANNVAFNWFGNHPRDIVLDGPGTFTLNSGYWGAAWGDQFLSFEGYNNGVLLYSSSGHFVNTLSPVQIVLNWSGIDQFRIVGTGDWWVLDNLEVNADTPEPTVLGFVGAGLIALAAARRKNR